MTKLSVMEKLRKKLRYRSPLTAAIANFFIPGLGYLYNGRRRLLGGALIASLIMILSASFAVAGGKVLTTGDVYRITGVVMGAWLITASALAWDAYNDAKRHNAQIRREDDQP